MARISERLRYDMTNTRVNASRSRNSDALEQMTTMKRINQISDDPIGNSRSILGKDRIAMMKQYQKNMDFGNSYLERSEAAISGIHENLIRARELAVAMANDTYGPESRKASAGELKEIIESVVNLGNTKFANRYVFSGFRTATPALGADGKYLGDDGAIFVSTGEDQFSQVNLQSRALFEPTDGEKLEGKTGLIESLNMLYHGLNENDKGLVQRSMTQLDGQLEKASSFQATIGAMTNSFEGQMKRVDLDKELTMKTVSEIEDTDMFETASNFKRSETVLQSTLLASNKLLQPSLLNFLQ